MHCNRFIGETLVRFPDESIVPAAAARYREQVPSYKHLD